MAHVDDALHGGHDPGVVELPEDAHGSAQVHGTDDQAVQSRYGRDGVQFAVGLDVLDLDRNEQVPVHGFHECVDVRKGPSVVRGAMGPEAPVSHGRITAGVHHAAHLVGGTDLGDDDPGRARVQNGFYVADIARRHADERGGAARPGGHEVSRHRLEVHRPVLGVDPDEIRRIAQGLGHGRIGEGHAGAQAEFARGKPFAERTYFI